MNKEILKEKLKKLTPQQQEWIDEYHKDDMKKLKQITFPIFRGYNLPYFEYDDLYDDASDVLMESVVTFEDTKNAKFETYLTQNIRNSISQWYRDHYQRAKRKNLLTDKRGKIVRDEKGNPKIIANISLDAPVVTTGDSENNLKLTEIIASDYSIEDESGVNNLYSENITQYLGCLGETEREIAVLIIEGYSHEDIKKKLNLTDKKYAVYLADMRSYEKKRVLKNNITTVNLLREEKDMNILTSTSENKKDTSYSISSIIKKLEKHKLRDNHILQRESGQWTSIAKSELMSDVLQGNSLTPIIISEEIKNGMAMHWLIDGKQRCTNIHDFVGDGYAISKNVQVYNIQYITEKVDQDGNVIYNEDGFPVPEMRSFDIRGKRFSQLPEELQEKFLDYPLPVMMNLNCTKKKIAYDIARFNRCRPMSIAQNGWTGLDEVYAEYVDNILKMDFFKIDCKKSNYTKGNKKSGAMRRMIVEAIITSKYIEKFSNDFRMLCEFLTEEANESVFIDFYTSLDRLANVVTEDTSELFNMKNSFLWFALFEKFTTYNLNDKYFAEFLKAFVTELSTKKINGVTYQELDKNKTTKSKNVVKEKMNHLIFLMNDFLHIDQNKTENNKTENIIYKEESVQDDTEFKSVSENNEEYILEFVKENVNQDVVEEDLDFYEDMLSDTVKVDSLLYEKCHTVLIALMAYACNKEKDEEFESWIKKYEKTALTFSQSDKTNFKFMKTNFDDFLKKGAIG